MLYGSQHRHCVLLRVIFDMVSSEFVTITIVGTGYVRLVQVACFGAWLSDTGPVAVCAEKSLGLLEPDVC